MTDKERKSRSKASVKYNQKRDQIVLRPSTEEGQEIRDAADRAGETLSKYILTAIHNRIDSEQDHIDSSK